MIEITGENFEQEVLDSEEPVLVKCWTEWCVPCKVLTPTLDEIAEQSRGWKFCSLNVDKEAKLVSRLGISAVPTTIFFKGGAIIKSLVGLVGKEEIEFTMRKTESV